MLLIEYNANGLCGKGNKSHCDELDWEFFSLWVCVLSIIRSMSSPKTKRDWGIG